MCFPKIQWVPWIETEEGEEHELQGVFYPELNLIQLSRLYCTNTFLTLLHEVGHWLLFRLPFDDTTPVINLIYDSICHR